MTQEELDKIAIIYKDQKIGYLNPQLIKKNKVTDKEILVLKELHCEKAKLFEMMEATDVKEALRSLANLVTKVEFDLQRTWHFVQDERMHEWYKVPKCNCPKVDNMESRGTDYRIINQTCIIHGEE